MTDVRRVPSAELSLPPDFVVFEADVGDDRHAAGQRAARAAIAALDAAAALAYDGARPIVTASARPLSISITHGRTHAIAVAARVAHLGIDLVDDVDRDRLDALAPRYLADEAPLIASDPRARAEAVFAAKEAGLKALGLGLLDGGAFDTWAVRVTSLDPGSLETLCDGALSLVVARLARSTLAIAYR